LEAIHANKHPNSKWPKKRSGWHYGERTYNMSSFYPNFFEEVPEWNIEIVSGAADTACPTA